MYKFHKSGLNREVTFLFRLLYAFVGFAGRLRVEDVHGSTHCGVWRSLVETQTIWCSVPNGDDPRWSRNVEWQLGLLRTSMGLHGVYPSAPLVRDRLRYI